MWRLPHASPPNHRSQCRKDGKVTRELQTTTNYAKLLEEKIQGRVQGTKAVAEAQEEAQGGNAQAEGKATKRKGLVKMR